VGVTMQGLVGCLVIAARRLCLNPWVLIDVGPPKGEGVLEAGAQEWRTPLGPVASVVSGSRTCLASVCGARLKHDLMLCRLLAILHTRQRCAS
jgi:hypothetical protein